MRPSFTFNPSSSLSISWSKMRVLQAIEPLSNQVDQKSRGRPTVKGIASAAVPNAPRRPIASLRDTPVITSAARLNDVMRHSLSTVNTPSEMLSKIASVGLACGPVTRFLFVLRCVLILLF